MLPGITSPPVQIPASAHVSGLRIEEVVMAQREDLSKTFSMSFLFKNKTKQTLLTLIWRDHFSNSMQTWDKLKF